MATLFEVGETLKQNVKTLVEGVRKNQPSTDTTLYASFGRDLYATLKNYVALLSPSGVFINKIIEEEAKSLKESVRQLLQKGKVAFVEGNKNPDNNKAMEQCARAMLFSITKIGKQGDNGNGTPAPPTLQRAFSSSAGNGASHPQKVPSSSGNGTVSQPQRVHSTSTGNGTTSTGTSSQGSASNKQKRKGTRGCSIRITGKSQENPPPISPSPSQPLPHSQSNDPEMEKRKQEYSNMIRKSRRSISMARASVQAMLQTQQEEEAKAGVTRDRSKTMQQNMLLQQALAQIAAMESKMNDMERKMDDEVKKGGSITAIPAADNEMMQMLLSLQERLSETEKAVDREKKLIELEKKMTEKEQNMIAKEKAMEKRLEDMLKIFDKDKFAEVEAKLKKLDQIDKLMQSGGLVGGLPTKAYDTIKADVERLQKIIFDDKSTQKEIGAANIELEKAMKDLEKCPEFIEEQRKQKEEWLVKNETINKAAYERVSSRLKDEARKDPGAFRDKLTKCGELALILLSKESILKKHESDFKMYVLALDEEELRALRYNMPKFRSDQRVQSAFLESIDNKIKEKEKAPAPPPPIPKANRPKKKWKAKKGGGGGGSFLDELMKKTPKK